MVDENAGIKQETGVEPNIVNPTENVPVGSGKQVSDIPEINEYFANQEKEAKESKEEANKDKYEELKEKFPDIYNIPEVQKVLESQKPIKVGDKELTQEEIQQLKETLNIKESVDTPVIRDTTVIEAELKKLEDDTVSNTSSIFKKYLSRAQGDIQEAHNILSKAAQTGDYSKFVELLRPSDIQEFTTDFINLSEKYDTEKNKLTEEKEKSTFDTQFKENITKWENFINTELKDNASAKHFFDFGKKTALFDEGFSREALKVFNEAMLLAVNDKALLEQTNALKKEMMTIPTGEINTNRIFTREEIKLMSPDDFIKNEAEIFRQLNKGLIK